MKRILALSLCIIMALAMVIPASAAYGNPSGGSGSTTTSTTTSTGSIAGQNVKTAETTQSKANSDGSVTKTTTVKNTTDDGTTVTTETVTTTKKDGTVTTTETVKATVPSSAVTNAQKRNKPVLIPTIADKGKQVEVILPIGSGNVKVEIPMEKGPTAGTVLVAVDKEGNEKIIKKSAATENGIVAILDGSTTVKIADNTKTFNDVKNHWAEEAVTFAASRGIVDGVGDGQYDLEGTTTRAMVCTVLARFDDADMTSGEKWYDAGANWAKDKGVSDGTGMEREITREELVTMLYRYVGSPAVSGNIADFKDASQVSNWAVDAMQWAIQVGLIQGIGDSTLLPKGTATRAQLAAIMQRFCTKVAM